MSEFKGNESEGLRIMPDVVIIPTETVIGNDGHVGIFMDVYASSGETARAGMKAVEDISGGHFTDPPTDRGSSRRFFGFNSNNWGGSNWEPKGPDRNWGYNPEISPN